MKHHKLSRREVRDMSQHLPDHYKDSWNMIATEDGDGS